MASKIQFNKFAMEKMVQNAALLIVAKRGSGKSFLTRDIMYSMRKLPGGMVISPTDQMNPIYKKFFPDLFIHHDVSPTLLKAVLQRQTMVVKNNKTIVQNEKNKGGKSDIASKVTDPRAILVMDDCLAEAAAWKKDNTIRIIMMNGRHYQLTFILIMQDPMGVPPNLRSNFDYIFLLKEDTVLNRKKLWMNFAGVIPSMQAFEAIFDAMTNDFGCMVIDNRKPCSVLKEKIFHYKAVDRRFKFGSDEFVDIHKKYYDKNYLERLTRAEMEGGTIQTKKSKEGVQAGDIDLL
jgi:hypothetical protein